MDMTLSNFLMLIFNNFIIGFFYVQCWNSCIYNNEKNIKKTFLIVFLITILTTMLHLAFSDFNRIIIVFILFAIVCKFVFALGYKEAIILVVITQLITWIGEFSFAIVASLFCGENVQQFVQKPVIYFTLNIYICIIFSLLLKFQIPKRIYTFINKNYYSKNNDSLIYSLIVIAIIIISTIESYMELSLTVILITNVIMGIIFIGIIFMSSKIKANYNKISSKYETSISSLKEYEVMIDKFRVYTHENKNEFYTIRNMLKNGEDRNEVIKYIDTLIDNKIQDNEKIMAKTAKIPSGGLRATIYSKLCLMDKLKIKYKLNISRDVRTTDLIDLDEDLVLKICKILGVFLDNAIEAVKGLKKKQIAVEMYAIDNDLCIDITNKFKGNLDINKISEAKYTTKGDGHGYGLTLVNQIINDEAGKLENEKSINRDTFTQTLKIKM